VIQASGNRTFLTVWDLLHWDVRARVALRRIARPDGGGLGPLVSLHRALSTCVSAGDVSGAVEALQTLFRSVLEAIGTG
jgi:DNA-binding FadR family transcriptional regulator